MIKIKTVIKNLVIVLAMGLFQPIMAKSVASDATIEKAILAYVNEYRVTHHRSPLKMNSEMSKEAAQHSRDMATHRMSFGHKDFNKRIHRLFDHIQQCRGGAENVAYNYKDAQDVVKNWLTSPGHRRNIMGNYNLTGIGIARDQRGKIYFTQIFLRTDNQAYT